MQIDRPSSEPPPAGSDRVVVLGANADRSAAIGWCERVREMLVGQSEAVVICDVGRLSGSAAEVIDGLARLQLTAIRCGGAMRLRGADPDLVVLLTLFGLRDVLPDVLSDVLATGLSAERCPGSAAGDDDGS